MAVTDAGTDVSESESPHHDRSEWPRELWSLDGDRYFVLQKDGQTRYTQHGLFEVDDDGFLIDAFTGYYVQRTGSVGEEPVGESPFQQPGDQRIKFPLGREVPPIPTSRISLSGNLPENSTPVTRRILRSGQFMVDGIPATRQTLLNDLDSSWMPYERGDQLILFGQSWDGSQLTAALDVGEATTVDDVCRAISSLFAVDADVVFEDGRIKISSTMLGRSGINVSVVDDQSNLGESSGELQRRFEVLESGQFASSIRGAFPIIDNSGAWQSLSFQIRKVTADAWQLTFEMDAADGEVVDSELELIRFDADGRLLGNHSATDPIGTVTLRTVDADWPQQISISLQSPEGRDLVEGPGWWEIYSSADGFRPGEITAAFLSKNVNMVGVSNNGNVYPVADLGVAEFDAPEWLADAGFEQFEETHLSGPAVQRSNTAPEEFVPTWSYAFDETIDRFLQAHPQTVRPGFLLDDDGRLLLTVPGAIAAEDEVFHDQHDFERRLSTPAISSDEFDGAVEAPDETSRTWLDQLFRQSTPSLISTIIAADTGSTAGSLELELLSGEEDVNRQCPEPPVVHADYEVEPPVAQKGSPAKQ